MPIGNLLMRGLGSLVMLILFMISEVIARTSDRVRGRGAHSTDQWDDDELSPI